MFDTAKLKKVFYPSVLILAVLLVAFKVYASKTETVHVASTDEIEVEGVINNFFESLEAQDTAVLQKIILKESHYYVWFNGEKGHTVMKDSHENWMKGLVSNSDSQLKERVWDMDIKVFDGVASVTCAYDFYKDEVYSHCGVNIFSLVKTKEGWKIADTVFSVKKDCGESPLGPYPPK